MGAIRAYENVKPLLGILTSAPEIIDRIKPAIEKRLGPIEQDSGLFPWNSSSYYAEEMGEALYRRFLSFKKLIDPDGLAEIKRWTNDLEKEVASKGPWRVARPVNLDPGYISLAKLVLASTKDYSHRLPIGKGIYAEITLLWGKNTFTFRESTYPDYRTREYVLFFNQVRQTLADQILTQR